VTATTDADAALAMLAAAPEAGRSRATTIGGAVGIVLVVLLVLAILLVARRRRSRRTPLGITPAPVQAAAAFPSFGPPPPARPMAPPGPYATLPPDGPPGGPTPVQSPRDEGAP
jgi:hypothetical protein